MARRRDNENIGSYFSNYCGVGGFGLPQHETDQACKEHDEEYGLLQLQHGTTWPYIHWNDADEKFIRTLANIAPQGTKEFIVKNVAEQLFRKKKQILGTS